MTLTLKVPDWINTKNICVSFLVIAFCAALPLGVYAKAHWRDWLTVLIMGVLSSLFWLIGALAPLYMKDPLPPGLANGFAAVAALVAIAASVTIPA